MTPISGEALKPFASKYIWWKTPEEAVLMPQRVIAQVMNIGDFADMQSLAVQLGDDVLRDVLAHAEAGQFNERSWAYWHYCLELCGVDQVPPLPMRRFADPPSDNSASGSPAEVAPEPCALSKEFPRFEDYTGTLTE